jgi:hypothetical protein
MSLRIRWRTVALISSTAVILLLVQSALASSPATPTAVTAQGISGVTVVSEATSQTLTFDGLWDDIPGASATVAVPARWTSGLVLVQFTSSASCSVNYCAVRILVDGIEATPASGTLGAFTVSLEAHSMDRWVVVGPGKHNVQAQWWTVRAGETFTLSDWTLVVERARAS